MGRLIGWLSFSLLIVFSFTGCEDGESKDLASAQKCMDAVPSDNPSSASNCFAYVANYNSQQANILKCSIKLTSGGLNTDKIVQAYKVSENSSITNKEAAYVGFLALTTPDRATGYSIAQEAYPYCYASEVSGLLFIGGLSRMASMLAVAAGNDFDISDPTTAAAAIGTALEDCVSGSNSCNISEVAETVSLLSTTYCSNPSSDQEVCSDITTAISEAGGDTTTAAKKFMCELQKKTYDGSSCV